MISIQNMLKVSQVDVENFGPIVKGSFHRKKISIFFGPNNSGKSLFARLLHVYLTDSINLNLLGDMGQSANLKRRSPFFGQKRMIRQMMRIVVEPNTNVITYGKDFAKIRLHSGKNKIDMKFTSKESELLDDGILQIEFLKGEDSLMKMFESGLKNTRNFLVRDSIYIPAARTGAIQFFDNIMYMRNRWMHSIISTFGSSHPSDEPSNEELRKFIKSGKFPLYLENFFDLILEAKSEGFDKDIKSNFKELYDGQIMIEKEKGAISIQFRDPSGFTSDIEKAGSGVISSFPILIGLYKIANGGTFVVEEPEAHLEPMRQMKLLELLCLHSNKRNIDLIITTHSDYIVKKILSLVSKGEISHEDVGLYYFERPSKGLTTIHNIAIDESGDSEQPLFQEAIDSLINDYSTALTK